MSIDWNDPAARGRLAERVGPDEYNRLHRAHMKASVVSTVNGYDIRPVGSRFGTIYMVDGTDTGYQTQKQAEEHAAKLPARAAA